jgi:hypothetical protein
LTAAVELPDHATASAADFRGMAIQIFNDISNAGTSPNGGPNANSPPG